VNQADRHVHELAHANLDEVARVSCVRHRYEDGTEVALCGLDVVAHKGQRVAVLGPNGSGKTTLLFHLLGLLRSEEGLVRVLGVDPAREWKSVRRRIGVVLQNVDEQILAPSVLDDVAFSPRQYGLPESEVREMVADALARVGIEHLATRVPHNLSGGEKRKVALAGALVMRPELLVLDEPFEGLESTRCRSSPTTATCCHAVARSSWRAHRRTSSRAWTRWRRATSAPL